MYGQKCPICFRKIDIELPENILEGKDQFPFEYLYIHGDPPHAFSLFIDKNLAVREQVIHNDIKIDQTLSINKEYQKPTLFAVNENITLSKDYEEDWLMPSIPISEATNYVPSSEDYNKIAKKSKFFKRKKN